MRMLVAVAILAGAPAAPAAMAMAQSHRVIVSHRPPPIPFGPHRPPSLVRIGPRWVRPGRPASLILMPGVPVFRYDRWSPQLVVPPPIDGGSSPAPARGHWELPTGLGPLPGANQAALQPPPPPVPLEPAAAALRDPVDRARRPQPVDPARQKRAARLIQAGDRAFRGRIYSRAAENYAAAARVNPESAAACFKLAQANLAMGRYNKAADAIRRGMMVDPSWIEGDYHPIDLYADSDVFAGHRNGLEAHLFQDPTDLDARLVEGFLMFFSGQRAKALEAFLRLREDPVDAGTVRPFLELLGAAGRSQDDGPGAAGDLQGRITE